MGVDTGGAGDQGLMFGYACRETDVLMPLPITLAHRMAQRLAAGAQGRHAALGAPGRQDAGDLPYEDGRPVAVDTVVVSTQHDRRRQAAPTSSEAIATHVIEPVLADFEVDHKGLQAAHQPDGPLRRRRARRATAV